MTMALKELRRRAYLTTRELAAKADVTTRTLWRIESGRYNTLHPTTMRKIADALGVHPSEITEFVQPEG